MPSPQRPADTRSRRAAMLARGSLPAWLALLGASMLAGCAQVPVPGAAQAGQKSADRGDLRDADVRLQLEQALRGRGWIPVGPFTSAPGAEPDLAFLQLLTIKRTGEVVRVAHLQVFGTQSSAQLSAASMMTTRDYDCAGQTWRFTEGRAYSDRMATALAAKQPPLQMGAQPVTQGTLADRIYKAVCEGKASGSGVIVGNGMVLTNSHVVNNCRKLEASLDGQKFNSRIMAQDRNSDLALLQVEGLAPPAEDAKLRLRRSPLTGETVMVAGYPLGNVLARDLNVSSGVVNALAGMNNDFTKFQLQAPVQPGNSGGPVLDRSGNVVGLVVGRLENVPNLQVQNINFAIKPEIIKLFLAANQVSVTDADADTRLESEQIAARAKLISVKVDCSMRMAGG